MSDTPSQRRAEPSLTFAAGSAAALLFVLCAITLLSGVSQQHFEWVHAPDRYAADLLRDEAALRVIVAIDDLFVAAYVAVGLPRESLPLPLAPPNWPTDACACSPRTKWRWSSRAPGRTARRGSR